MRLIRAVGTENEGHWAGLIAAPVTYVVDSSGKVRWAYVSASAADRPSLVGLAARRSGDSSRRNAAG